MSAQDFFDSEMIHSIVMIAIGSPHPQGTLVKVTPGEGSGEFVITVPSQGDVQKVMAKLEEIKGKISHKAPIKLGFIVAGNEEGRLPA